MPGIQRNGGNFIGSKTLKLAYMNRIFEIALILHPTEDQAKEGIKSEFLLKPQFLLCKDMDTANKLAITKIPGNYLHKIDQIEVAVRPF